MPTPIAPQRYRLALLASLFLLLRIGKSFKEVFWCLKCRSDSVAVLLPAVKLQAVRSALCMPTSPRIYLMQSQLQPLVLNPTCCRWRCSRSNRYNTATSEAAGGIQQTRQRASLTGSSSSAGLQQRKDVSGCCHSLAYSTDDQIRACKLDSARQAMHCVLAVTAFS